MENTKNCFNCVNMIRTGEFPFEHYQCTAKNPNLYDVSKCIEYIYSKDRDKEHIYYLGGRTHCTEL